MNSVGKKIADFYHQILVYFLSFFVFLFLKGSEVQVALKVKFCIL